jgi:hypothetical protein
MTLYVDSIKSNDLKIENEEASTMTIFYTKGDLARAARMTNQGIIYAERRGDLKAVAKTVRGVALYDQKQAEQFLRNREQGDRK